MVKIRDFPGMMMIAIAVANFPGTIVNGMYNQLFKSNDQVPAGRYLQVWHFGSERGAQQNKQDPAAINTYFGTFKIGPS